jgi:hypothetical protein
LNFIIDDFVCVFTRSLFFLFNFLKIFMFLQLQEQAVEKRHLLEETCRKSEEELIQCYNDDIENKKKELEAQLQNMLTKAARDEGFVIGEDK